MHSHGTEICPQVILGSVDAKSDLRREFHKYFLRATRTSPGSHPGGGCRFRIMSKSNRSIPPACKYAGAASSVPQLKCSCAAQERTRKKLSRLRVGKSARIIEGSSWQPCTTSLALKAGSLGVKTQRVPTIFEIFKSRFQHAQFTLRQWQCCLVLFPFLPFTWRATEAVGALWLEQESQGANAPDRQRFDTRFSR